MKNSLIIIFLLSIANLGWAKTTPEYYELKIYTIAGKAQGERIDNYLKNAYLPAMHRQGQKTIGVFKPVAADTAAFGKYIYVLTPFKSIKHLLKISEKLKGDAAYLQAGNDYIEATYKTPPYERYQSIVLQAFVDAPRLNTTKLTGPKAERIYELRSYEGHTEKIYENKVKMFNAGGEIELFNSLNFNAIFYGKVIVGNTQPNLMYMTAFENKADRDKHWQAFGASPVWSKLKVDPEYQNNVSKNIQKFLYPTEYSDL